jgi:ribosome-binding factor A
MQSRRQEKVNRLIKEAVSDAIANHLNDPRIEGFISVTKVESSPNLRDAEVYLSIFGTDEKTQKRTFIAIEHARPKIQIVLGRRVKSKFCPILHFHMDEAFKKTIDILNVINEASKQFKENQVPGQDEDLPETDEQ